MSGASRPRSENNSSIVRTKPARGPPKRVRTGCRVDILIGNFARWWSRTSTNATRFARRRKAKSRNDTCAITKHCGPSWAVNALSGLWRRAADRLAAGGGGSRSPESFRTPDRRRPHGPRLGPRGLLFSGAGKNQPADPRPGAGKDGRGQAPDRRNNSGAGNGGESRQIHRDPEEAGRSSHRPAWRGGDADRPGKIRGDDHLLDPFDRAGFHPY